MGSRGVVYSVALSDDAVAMPAQRPVFGHVKLRHRDNDRLPFTDSSLDLVLWAFTLRTVAHMSRMLSETKRVLRPGGRFAVADWIRQDEAVGPLRDDRISAATCQRCLTAGGFGVLGELMLNASHYVVVGRRPFADMAPVGMRMLNAM